MARIRTIKPDFWTHGEVIECSLIARLLFIGTWNFCDDEGNLARSAKQLKAQIFPADSIEVEPLIQELITQGLLSEYSVNGKFFLHIHGFKKHQVINRPSPPKYPLYDESLRTHGVFMDDSLLEGKGREGKGTSPNGDGCVVEQPVPEKQTKSKTTDTRESTFEIFWKYYPRKVGRGAAEKAWLKVDQGQFSLIIKAIEVQKRSEQWLRDGGQFIPHPSTWLNEKRWMDEGVTVEDGGLSAAGRQTAQAVQDFLGNNNGGEDAG
jgi:hypothetical protein